MYIGEYRNTTLQVLSSLAFSAWYEKPPIDRAGSGLFPYLPLMLYSCRCQIKTGYYEQKTFWSLRKYMLRSRRSIKTLLNVINVAYAAMKILPYADASFSKYRNLSPQELRSILDRQIQEQVFIYSLRSKLKF